MQDRVIVIGGGVGGLTAALALLRRGIDVEVYEQTERLGEVGAGLQISSNGTRVLDALGLQERLARVEVVSSRRGMRHWKTGEHWNWFDLGDQATQRYGTRHMLLHRGDLHEVLADEARVLKAGAIKLGKRCVDLIQSGPDVDVLFETGETARASYVLGADGIHSRVRACLFGMSDAEYTGCVAWRGLVPMERLPSPIATSIPTNWFGPCGHVLHYPIRRGELMNFVGTLERPDRPLARTAVGTTEELADDFRGWHQDVQAIIEKIDSPVRWPLMVRPPMDSWSRGRVTLLGDACHPTLPFLGQGAVMAIEDAFIVATCIHKHFANPAAAFSRYEEIRRERTSAVVKKAQQNRERAFSPALVGNDAVAAALAADRQKAPVRERLDWLYNYDATRI